MKSLQIGWDKNEYNHISLALELKLILVTLTTNVSFSFFFYLFKARVHLRQQIVTGNALHIYSNLGGDSILPMGMKKFFGKKIKKYHINLINEITNNYNECVSREKKNREIEQLKNDIEKFVRIYINSSESRIIN